MPVTFINQADTVTAFLSGELDHHGALDIREAIDAAAESALPGTLVLDFSDVAFMDSSGIGLIMGRFKMSQAIGAALVIQNASPRLRRMIRMAGLEQLPIRFV